MSLDQTTQEEIMMGKELLEVLERVIRHTGGGIIGSLGSIDSSDSESFAKLVAGTVIRKLHCVIQPALEDLIRRVTKELIDAAFEKILTGNPANEIHFLEKRRLLLKFKYKIPLPVWTGIPIKNIEVSLVDSVTGEIIKSGPEASAKVEIVVLKGDDNHDGELDFEGFNQNIVQEREGNKPLLGGKVNVDLEEGIGFAKDIYFSHRSVWMKNCRFRLGARIKDNTYGSIVRDAVTESFVIRDRRMKLYEKHEIPSLSDELWRLKHISRRGAFYKRLIENNITTVEQFLTEHSINPQNLKEIAGATISDKKLKETVVHALKCELADMYYMSYPSCGPQKVGIVFNVVGQLLGALYESHYVPIDNLPEDQKIEAHELIVSAFKNWCDVIPLGKNLPSFDGADVSNALYAPNSHGVESLEPDNYAARIVNNNHENAVSCTSYQGIASPNTSNWSVNITDDFDMYCLRTSSDDVDQGAFWR